MTGAGRRSQPQSVQVHSGRIGLCIGLRQIETDRCRAPGPTEGDDLWWSGKHEQHGGNVQVITAPDGWPIWTSDVRPGREHDTTAVRAHAEILPALVEAGADLRTRGDLGYEGLADTVTVAFKNPKNGGLLLVQLQFNKAHRSSLPRWSSSTSNTTAPRNRQ